GLKRVRLCQRAGQILVILAVLTAKFLDRGQLLFGEIVLALDDIGFAKVLAHLRVIGIERNRLEVVANPFVGASKLAGRVAAIVERAGSIRVVQKVEHVDGFLVPVSLSERISVFRHLGVRQDVAAPNETFATLRVPDLAGFANREVRRDVRAGLGLVEGSSAAARAPSSSAPSATAGRVGGRSEREASSQQSRTKRRNEIASL